MRRLLVIATAVSACSSEPLLLDGSGWTCRRFSNRSLAPLSIGTVGEEMTVRIDSTLDCEQTGAVATANVIGPESSLVRAMRVTLVDHERAPDVAPHLAVYVTFTPLAAGRHHVVVRLDPNIELLQTEVVVAADLRDTPVGHRFDLSSPIGDCTQVHEAEGELLCLGPHVSTHDSLGGLKQLLAASGVAGRAGGVLWLASESTHDLRRCTRAAGLWDCDSTGSIPFQRAWLLLPTAHDTFAFAQNSAEAWQVSLDAGVLTSMAIALAPEPVQPAAAFREGDDLWWTASMSLCGVIGATGVTLNCGAPDAGDATTGIAVGENGAWTLELSSSVPTIERITTTSRQRLQLPYSATYSTTGTFSWGSTAFFEVDGAHFRVRYNSGALELDRLPDRGAVVSATETSFVMRDEGSLLFFRR